MLRGKRVVVTGGAGFLGSHVVERLAGGNDVVVFDDLERGGLRNLTGLRDRVRVVKGSILNPRALGKACRDADVVLHLAALVSVVESVREPVRYARTNVLGTLHVMLAAREAGARRVVLASSAAVYGTAEGSLREDRRPEPASPYAATKLACERLAHALLGEGPTDAVVLRPFNVYGPRQSASSTYAAVVARFCDAAVRGAPVTVFGDGSQTRDFVYAGDVAEAFDRAATARAASGRVLNVGTGRETSIAELLRLMGEIRGSPLRVVRRPWRRSEVRRSVANTALARSVLGFRATTALREGLRRTVEAYGEGRSRRSR